MNRSSGRAGLAISMTDEQADGRTDGQCVTTRVRSVECRVESVPLSERGRERERFICSVFSRYVHRTAAAAATLHRTAPPPSAERREERRGEKILPICLPLIPTSAPDEEGEGARAPGGGGGAGNVMGLR